eukprot:4328557-Pleurochrysis_carterae.AAC.1
MDGEEAVMDESLTRESPLSGDTVDEGGGDGAEPFGAEGLGAEGLGAEGPGAMPGGAEVCGADAHGADAHGASALFQSEGSESGSSGLGKSVGESFSPGRGGTEASGRLSTPAPPS